jgi:type IV pilus assembly protein PilY1
VTAVNDPPVGIQQKDYIMQENGSLVVDAASGLLAGAYDVDGALLDGDGNPIGSFIDVIITTFPAIGSLSVNQATGTFEYTPPVNFTGTVDFEYRLRDGITQSPGDPYRVTVTVLEAPEPPAPPPAGEVAIIYNLANAPLEQATSVPPNVLVVMDDSGSMDWNLIVAGEGQDGGFVLDNSDRANSGRRSTSYVYLWDLRNNAYPDSSVNGRILPTPEALEADSDTDGNEYGVWRARTHLHNSIYYNPAIQYTPWIGQDAANQEFADANPNSIRLDPRNPSTAGSNRIDILAGHSYRATNVPEWDNNGGTTTVDVDDMYIPHYYATTATPPLAWNDPHAKVEIRPGTGPLAGGLFPGGAERDDCAIGDGNPNTCTYAQEIQNFANFFQYYRSREYVTKNGIGKTVSQMQDIRIGYLTISNTTSEDIREMNALHTEGNKKALLDNIYRVDSYGGTPLRQALGRAGDVFSCSFGTFDCPYLPEPEGFCQQNFALLFSDGYWNGGTGTSGNRDGDNDSPFDGGRYADTITATLADVAMYYYENDLRPDLDDEVPVMRRDLDGVPDGVFPDADPKMHQHMKTYSIAFGVSGTVDPASIPSNPTTPFAWPNPFSGNLEKIDDMLHAAVNGRGRFLNAGSPTELQAAFEAAFLEFTQAASSTSSAAFNSTSLQEGTLLYRGFYDLRDNTGELTATLVNPDGSLAPAPTWRASERLNPGNLLPTNRVITTFEPGVGGMPFRYASLTPEQQLTLNAQQVDYLRGVRTAESPSGPLRERPASDGLLGDIVNSSPVFVGAPRAINRDQRPYPVDDLYSEFAEDRASRTPVVYVGANDGMLHGFNGITGDELFAYVPNKIIDSSQGHKNPLDLFTSPFYQHRYYVDLSPRLNDAYMRSSRSAVGKSWNTVLVGGLGVGGKGFFALNVTDPDGTYANEISASSAALWEFTDEDDAYPVQDNGTPLGGFVGAITDPLGQPVKDLGYSVSLPVVTMSNVDDGGSPSRKEWVALFGNGPNSTAGIAKLFVLFMDRGLNGWGPGDFVKLNTNFGVQSPPHPLAGYPNYLGTPAAVDTDLNGTVDRVYAGDRLGNLFRFDLSDTDSDNWTVTRLFTATYDDGGTETVQPIVTEPLVIRHPTERGFLIIFGTGSYLTRSDADSSDIQSIYAIWDEGSSAPATALDDTKELRLVEQTITNVMDASFTPPVVRRIVSREPVNYQQEGPGVPGTYGWYIDLDMERAVGDTTGRAPPSPQFPGEKAIRRLLFRDGAVITTTVLPSLDEFSCFGTRPGSILVFDAVSGGDAGRPVVDFNTDGYVDSGDLVSYGGFDYSAGLLFNQSDLDGQLVDLSTLGGEGDTDFLFVSGGNETISFRIDDVNDNRTGRLSWRELNIGN